MRLFATAYHWCSLPTKCQLVPSAEGSFRRPEIQGRTRLLSWLAVSLIWAATGGCGPLGAYSLAHSLIAHHVFKPVLPDEVGNERPELSSHDRCETPGRNSRKSSSGAREEPMDSGRVPQAQNVAGDESCED
ncbi:MAG TPA: hypothetical protein VFI31_01805 [Pirellulales bacterium]|nr:hypothetical protein [Pirellulales bacterium]